jgi:hypothetical protein
MTPVEFLNTAVPWIIAVGVAVWVAVMVFDLIFGRDED